MTTVTQPYPFRRRNAQSTAKNGRTSGVEGYVSPPRKSPFMRPLCSMSDSDLAVTVDTRNVPSRALTVTSTPVGLAEKRQTRLLGAPRTRR